MPSKLDYAKNRHNKARGEVGETAAAKFLESAGFTILERNYRFDRGEIDIVAEDKDELVFVEVKSRQTLAFGSPEDAITPKKESYLKRTAEGYLFEHRLEGKPCRFDVVAIEWKAGRPDIRHIKNVF